MKTRIGQSHVLFPILFGLSICLGILLNMLPRTKTARTLLHSLQDNGYTNMAHPTDIPITRSSNERNDESVSTGSPLRVSSSSLYSPFTIAIGEGWTSKKKTLHGNITVTITNGEYTLEISQQPSSILNCVMSGSSSSGSPAGLSDPVEIIGVSGMYLRALSTEPTDSSKKRYIICEKRENQQVTPTTFGSISYITPVNPSDIQLLMMDIMLASVK